MNRIEKLFRHKKNNVLSIYFTAGFPRLGDTINVLNALQNSGTDIVELGIPYSDPLADGPVIQHSSAVALQNGITIKKIFEQLRDFRNRITLPVILMGYLNPVLQYGIEKFCEDAQHAGIDGLILPDLPIDEYKKEYKRLFKKHALDFIFLITPETSEERIRKIDHLSKGFIYAVSSSSITGVDKNLNAQQQYFERLKNMRLKNPVMIGFGIKDHATFLQACAHASGAIIGTAYIRSIENSSDIYADTQQFVSAILSAGTRL
ncbi:MAG TPA: tryptophan synthase subunit alpha [Chitinophagaceae bacterium]|nr:tryptophan synthase subunit alpha [Chitinophagaceae bacterium]